MSGYAVVQTHPNSASIVAENLRRQAFEFYDPVILQRVRRGGRMIYARVSLFQNYVFVRVVDRWRALRDTRGVSNLLMAAPEKPAIVPDEFIDGIRAMERNGCVVLPKPRKMFKFGQRVTVSSGPMLGCVGLYDGQSSDDRVFVLFGSMRARVKEDDLAAA